MGIKKPPRQIFRFLDTAGDGSGTKNATGDYSSTPAEFYFEATKGNAYIERLLIEIVDTTGMDANDYGNINNGLTNGYSILVLNSDDLTLLDLTDGIAIKTNAGIGRNCYDSAAEGTGSGNDFWHARWTFGKSGFPIFLSKGDKLSITLNDDCTGLIEHYFKVDGYYD